MCSIALQVQQAPERCYIIALSIFESHRNGDYVYNCYWPQCVAPLKELCMGQEETRKFFNVHHMWLEDKTIRFGEVRINAKSYFDPSPSFVRRQLDKLISKYRYVLMHEDDIEKWLCVETFANVRLERVRLVKTEHRLSELCRDKNEHTVVSCTMCRCHNVWKLREYYHYEYDADEGHSFARFAYKKRLISYELYRIVHVDGESARARREVRGSRSATPPETTRRWDERSKSVAPFSSRSKSVAPTTSTRRDRSTSVAPSRRGKSVAPTYSTTTTTTRRWDRSRSVAPYYDRNKSVTTPMEKTKRWERSKSVSSKIVRYK